MICIKLIIGSFIEITKITMNQGTIPESQLLMYMHGMELNTRHYKNVKDMHLKLLGHSEKPRQPFKYWEDWFTENEPADNLGQLFPTRLDTQITTDKERELLSDMLDIIRYSMRFCLTKDYINQFVTSNIHSFADLLQFGRYVLSYLYQNKDIHIDTATAVEATLFNEADWPILQMIKLNNWMFTHASTNFPCQLFQSMFVHGYVDTQTATKLKEKLALTTYEYSFKAVDPLDNELQPQGLATKIWKNDLLQFRIRDPVLENRNLYMILIEIFESL